MQITNRFGLPEVLVEAVRMDSYDAGRRGEKYVSVTQLVNPPQLTKLFWKHEHEIVVDVTDMLWALRGQAMHVVIERAAKSPRFKDRVITEERFYTDLGGWTIGGRIDLYETDTGILHDFKDTSVFSAENGGHISWRRQVNILAYLLRKHGYEVRAGQIVAMLKDWSRTKAKFKRDYFDHQATVVPIELVSDERIERFMLRQLAELDSDTPRECTDEERWMRGGNWAVMPGHGVKWAVRKEGRSTAVKVYDSQRDAELHASSLEGLFVERREPKTRVGKRAVKGGVFKSLLEAEQFIVANAEAGYRLEGREAVYQRCEAYCPVRALCPQALGDSVNFVDP